MYYLLVLSFIQAQQHVQEIDIIAPKGPFLSEDEVKQLLVRANLPNPDFNNTNCLQVRKIESKKIIYTIFSTCAHAEGAKYILKGSKDPEGEIEGLLGAASINGISHFSELNNNPIYPRIIFPIAYLSYTQNNEKKIMLLMPTATGKQLSDMLKNNDKDLPQAYKQFGFQMGNFYRFYMKPPQGKIFGPTVIHGDLHDENIFFDPVTQQISLIDNAGMKMFNQDYAVFHDLSWAFEGIVSSKNPQPQLLIKELLKGFLLSFNDVTGANQRNILLEFNKNIDSTQDVIRDMLEELDARAFNDFARQLGTLSQSLK